MANRLLLSTGKFRTSKLGVDVLTASDADLLINDTLDTKLLQHITAGTLDLVPNAIITVTFPSRGYKPLVLFRPAVYVNGSTEAAKDAKPYFLPNANIIMYNCTNTAFTIDSNTVDYVRIYWFIFNIPAPY